MNLKHKIRVDVGSNVVMTLEHEDFDVIKDFIEAMLPYKAEKIGCYWSFLYVMGREANINVTFAFPGLLGLITRPLLSLLNKIGYLYYKKNGAEQFLKVYGIRRIEDE